MCGLTIIIGVPIIMQVERYTGHLKNLSIYIHVTEFVFQIIKLSRPE